MGLNYNFSDYGSGSSSSSSSWASQQDIRWSSFAAKPTMDHSTQKAASYSDLVKGRCTLDDVMREFHMNGSDAPYNPDEDRIWGNYSVPDVSVGTSSYMRQKSWPAPERSPAARLPKPEHKEFATSTPVFNEFPPAPFVPPALSPPAPPALPALTSEQERVLRALPGDVLHALLRQLQLEKRTRVYQECRFCKNNGERESYYRSHVLKDARGRVACPVLRAFTCARCGARGDAAHTIKYCPLSTNEERIKSMAMMRSVRMASGRRRGAGPSSAGAGADYVVFGEAPTSVLQDNTAFSFYETPLDPLWAALEQKLML